MLGLVLQSQIAERLLQGKLAGALAQAEAGRVVLEGDLSGVDPDREGAQDTLASALQRLTNSDSGNPGSRHGGRVPGGADHRHRQRPRGLRGPDRRGPAASSATPSPRAG